MDILLAIYSSLIICGVYASTWDGMIFGNIRAFIDNYVDKSRMLTFLAKPVYGCIICMSSVWGGSIYLLSKGFSIGIIPHILTVAGINTIISGIIFLAYERNTNG